jgi:hypothetical protein
MFDRLLAIYCQLLTPPETSQVSAVAAPLLLKVEH